MALSFPKECVQCCKAFSGGLQIVPQFFSLFNRWLESFGLLRGKVLELHSGIITVSQARINVFLTGPFHFSLAEGSFRQFIQFATYLLNDPGAAVSLGFEHPEYAFVFIAGSHFFTPRFCPNMLPQ
ncbi:hypothetical protein RW64_09390 [Geobacter sulfurreducens]|nr:hypothetical protein RW64_09390 [Geobacter sulfurreducens]